MAKINCAKCGKLIETNGFRSLCDECFVRDMQDFDRIRDFLYIHPRSKIFEVSNSLDIPVPVIKRYLREGRLEIVEKDQLFLKCEKCGKPIRSGMYCDDCLKQVAHDYKSAFNENDPAKKKLKVTYK